MSNYVAPARFLKSFTCPHSDCGTFAQQIWQSNPVDFSEGRTLGDSYPLATGICQFCGKPSIWLAEKMIHPSTTSAPPAHPDMPDDALKDYSEAAEVVACSPRAAAALLRLSVQRLCVHLGGDGKNLNDDIGQLVAEKRLHPTIQQSLDVVRVIGNGMVHPGQIADDSAKTVSKLFGLINVVVNQTISAEKEVQAQFEDLPEDKKLQIQKRDAASGLT